MTQAKFKNKTRGEGCDFATPRIGPRYRAQKSSFSAIC